MLPSLVARINRTGWCLVAAILLVSSGVADRMCAVASANTVSVTLTFYGYPDNTPPGTAIHYPGPPPRHSSAGGIGTYDNPTTAAGGRWAAGTRMYLPYLRKYLILEDSCSGCGPNHIDVWVGGTKRIDPAVTACEYSLTPTSGPVEVEIDPPPGYSVNAGTLC